MTAVATVSYGDKYPVTPEGKAVAITLMLLGVAMFGLVLQLSHRSSSGTMLSKSWMSFGLPWADWKRRWIFDAIGRR